MNILVTFEMVDVEACWSMLKLKIDLIIFVFFGEYEALSINRLYHGDDSEDSAITRGRYYNRGTQPGYLT